LKPTTDDSFEMAFDKGDVRVLADDTVYRGHFAMRRVTLSHRLFAGGWSQPHSRELFERGDAVGVLPWDPQRDELVMLEQFRAGAMRDERTPWMLELVAGVVEPGESDAEVARREAVEEAGLEVGKLAPVAAYYPSAGACSEQVRLFIGRVDARGAGGLHGLADEGEDIRVHVLPRERVMAALDRGEIVNGHTLVALQWLRIHGESLRADWD
jgi:ADP-ribose pyrophosphatase